MVDASYRGLFVRMAQPPPVRELIKLRIELPNREFDAHAVVVRIVGEDLSSPMSKTRVGVGLRFFALNGQDKIEWESFITAALNAAKAA